MLTKLLWVKLNKNKSQWRPWWPGWKLAKTILQKVPDKSDFSTAIAAAKDLDYLHNYRTTIPSTTAQNFLLMFQQPYIGKELVFSFYNYVLLMD